MTNQLKSLLRRASARLLLFGIFGLFVPLILIWCTLVIHYTFNDHINTLCILLYVFGSIALLLIHQKIEKAVQIFSAVSLVIVLWFIFIPASNDRNWVADASKLPKIHTNNELITIDDFRFFKYENGKAEEHFIQKQFKLNELVGTDMVLSYWDDFRSIGHTMVCFRFKDGQNIAVSLEVRKEIGEEYSPTKGMFKQYELIYIIGDERDLIPLRTKVRHEETFLYPMNLTVAHSKLFLLDILKAANKLHDKPRFYHSIGQNCTTTLIDHLNNIEDFNIPLTSKVLLNGVSDYYAYKLNAIPTDLPFEVLKRSCYISDIANHTELDEHYSANIRKYINQKIAKERELSKQ